MPLTAEQRTIRARAAAYTRWSRESGRTNALRGQAGLRGRFRREAESAFPGLPPAELDRRADCAYRAHMARLALRSSRVRSRSATPKPGTPPPSDPPGQPGNPGGPQSPPKQGRAAA